MSALDNKSGGKNFSSQFVDAISEIVNIGMGRAASQLNLMVSSKVVLQVPRVTVLDEKEIVNTMGNFGNQELFCVGMNLSGDLAGMAKLLFMPEGASKLVSLLTHQPLDSPDLDSLKIEVLNEVGNILINSVVGSLANICHVKLLYSIPNYKEGTLGEIVKAEGEMGKVVAVDTAFNIKEYLIEGKMLLLFHIDSIDTLVKSIEQPS
jgi:chemotaxis protein CheC